MRTPVGLLVYTFTHIAQVRLPKVELRYLHSTSASDLALGLTEVTLFGGCLEEESFDDIHGMAKTTVLQFSKFNAAYK